MDVGGGDSDNALHIDEHAAVALDAHKDALGTGKVAADDAHALAFGKVARFGVEVDEFHSRTTSTLYAGTTRSSGTSLNWVGIKYKPASNAITINYTVLTSLQSYIKLLSFNF